MSSLVRADGGVKLAHKPRVGWRAVLTILILAVGAVLKKTLGVLAGPVGGHLGVGQVNGSNADYMVTRAFVSIDWMGIVTWSVVILVVATWLHFGVKLYRYQTAREAK